jgi:hypothetical protein
VLRVNTFLINVGGIIIVDHVVEVSNLALRVGDDRELEVGAGNLINVLDPLMVRLNAVGTETNQLDTTSSKLRFELGESTELSGANGSEVILWSFD